LAYRKALLRLYTVLGLCIEFWKILAPILDKVKD